MNTRRFIGTLGIAMLGMVILSSTAWGIIYVDANVAGSGNTGLTWDNAYTNLQDAMGSGDEVWVAQGTYYTTTNGGVAGTYFAPVSNVEVYGGFTNGMTSLAQRDWDAYETIASGEFQQNGNPTDNATYVFYVLSGRVNVVIDGLTITGAYNAGGSGGGIRNRGTGTAVGNCTFVSNSANFGAGLYVQSAVAPVSNCVFLANQAVGSGFAAGAYVRQPTEFLDCNFADNDGDLGGGGMFTESLATLRRCVFGGNIGASEGGGAIYVASGGSVAAYDSIFSGNESGTGAGGAIYVDTAGTGIGLERCAFVGNRSTRNSSRGGGAVYVSVLSTAGIADFTNCVFVGNRSEYRGGALWCGVTTTVQNCTFRENEAVQRGGAIYNEGSDGRYVQINNSIFFDNGEPPANNRDLRLEATAPGTDTVSWSLFSNVLSSVYVNGVASFVGVNLSADPLFADDISGTFTAALQEDADTGQVILTDSSKSWTVNEHVGRFVLVTNSFNGAYYIASNSANTLNVWANSATLIGGSGEAYDIIDVHLKSTDGRYANLGWITDDVDSPCIDAGNPVDAYALELSPSGTGINMGAYGNTSEASKGPPVGMIVLIR